MLSSRKRFRYGGGPEPDRCFVEGAGPDEALKQLDELMSGDVLKDYYLAHAAQGDFCERLGRREQARRAFEQALVLTEQGPERRYLIRRIDALADASLDTN